MRSRAMSSFILGGLIAFVVCGPAVAGQKPFGYLENVLVYPGTIPMTAKLDTGADNTAIHAINIVHKKRDGKPWVSFDVVTKTGETRHFEKPVVRTAKIKRRAGQAEQRPVVQFEICLGAQKRATNVSLVDRGHFDYYLLIGRSFMAGYALVDSAAKFTTEPNCR